MTDHRPFRYHPNIYSVGDRYVVTLAYPDEASLRADLVPLDLGIAAELKVGETYVEANGAGMWVEAFGPCVTLRVGPEDAYEFLEGEHHQLAASLASAFRERGIARFAIEPFEPVGRGNFDATFSPAHARLAEHERAQRERNRGFYRLRVGAAKMGGFETTLLGGYLDEAPDITEETMPTGLVPGMLGRATLWTGKRLDGAFGRVVASFQPFPPNPAIERYRPIFEALESPMPEAEEDASSLAARIIVARGGMSPALLKTPMAIVSAALTFLRDLHLPCLFDARRAVLEDRDDLFPFVIAQLNASLEGDPRRFAPLTAGEDAGTFVALSAPERALLESVWSASR